MEIASVLGMHAVTSAAPILAELAGEASPDGPAGPRRQEEDAP